MSSLVDIGPVEKGGVFHVNKLETPSPKNAFCQVWLQMALWLRTRFLKFINVVWLFCYFLSLEKGGVLHSNKHESPSPKDTLCQVLLKLAQWFLRRRFKISSMHFRYFLIICPWKRAGPFICTTLNLHYRRKPCVKFGWNWSSSSKEEAF